MSSHFSAGRFSVLAYQPGNPLFPTLPDITQPPDGWSRLGTAVLADATTKRRSRTPRSDSAAPGLFGESEGTSFWYLDQIFVQPQPVDFGNISGERVRAMALFHTKRSAIELTNVDLTPVQPGVTIQGITLPRLLRPFSEVAFTVTASVQGLAEFDALVPFTFEDAEDVFPHIETISPDNADDGTAGPLSVTVTGENFTADTVGRFEDQDRDTTFVSATQLTVDLETGDLDEPGSFDFRVFDPRGGQSNLKQFVVNYLTPVLSDVTASAPDVDGNVLLTVDGADFYDGVSVVRYNAAELATTFVSTAQLTAVLPAANVAESGAIAIDVDTEGEISGDFQLPVPTLDSLTPNEVESNAGTTQVVLAGADFFPHSVARLGGVDQPTTFDSETQLTADLDTSSGGVFDTTVFNPTPGGGESAALSFTVVEVFALTSIGEMPPLIEGDDVEMYGGQGNSGSDGTNVGGDVDLTGWGATVGDKIEVEFDRTYVDTWYDDDFTDSGFGVAVYFETAIGSIVHGGGAWEYNRPWNEANGTGIVVRHRRSHTLRPGLASLAAAGGISQSFMDEVKAGTAAEDSGPVHERLVFEKVTSIAIKCRYYIDGLLRFELTKTATEFNTMTVSATAAVLLHYHRYSSFENLGVDADDVSVTVTLAEEPTETTVASDTFTDTDGVEIEDHALDTDTVGGGWVATSSGGGFISDANITIQSNGLEFTNTAEQAIVDVGASDFEVEFDWTLGTGDNRLMVPLRSSADGQDSISINLREPNSDIRISPQTNGSRGSPVATTAYSFTDGQTYHIRLVAIGDIIEVWIDGVLEISTTTSIAEKETHTGLGTATITTMQRFDTYSVVVSEVAVAAGTTLVEDTFTDADGTAITRHVPDTDRKDRGWFANSTDTGAYSDGDIDIVGNTLSVSDSQVHCMIDCGLADHVVEFDWTLGAGDNRAQCPLRMTDETGQNGIMLLLREPNSDISLIDLTSGNGTNVASTAYTFSDSATYTVRVEITGEQYDVYIDDVLELSATISAYATGTYAGVGAANITAAQTFDNFTVKA